MENKRGTNFKFVFEVKYMKKESKVENNKTMEQEKEEILEKAAKLSEVGKAYVGVSESELTQEEEILRSTETPEVKEQLVATLKHVDKYIMKPTDAGVSLGKGKKQTNGIAKKSQKGSVQKEMTKEANVQRKENPEKSIEER